MQQQLETERPCELCQAFKPGPATQRDFQSDYGTTTELKTRDNRPICRLILKMLPSGRPTIPHTMVPARQGRVLVDGELDRGITVFYDGTY